MYLTFVCQKKFATNLSFREGTLTTNGDQTSTLTVLEGITTAGDADFKCMVSVMTDITEQLVVPLKTFSVRCVQDSSTKQLKFKK